YNPPPDWQERLALALDACRHYAQLKVAVVDDGSAPAADLQRLTDLLHGVEIKRLRFERNRGKGAAVRAGAALFSDADYYFYTDSDFPYRPEDVGSIVRALDEGADVAPGMRGPSYFANIPVARRFISRILSAMIKALVRIPFSDTQCGLKGFNAKGRELLLKTRVERFLFDVEFIYLSYHTPGVKVVPVSVVLRDGIQVSGVGPGVLLRELGNFLRILYRIYFRGW
ncbi:MAG: glycosyltransferase family 2 protein, partial [Bacteroidia bacterium]|nr:glycosyltransferase family 2 protein [Bacteroidia bacterium]MDW8333287.1 glycosyltransferase family 2 protein [Bacteroidia bacterium]